MKYIYLLLFVILLFSSCEKDQDIPVRYLATDAISGYNVIFRTGEGTLITDSVVAASAQDKWEYTFNAKKGDIVYLSAIYKDINSGIKLVIYVDGKIYKQASNQYDTTNYLIVSGAVPY